MGTSKPSSTSTTASSFATLEPRIKNISQSTVRRRWKPLPASSQEKVRRILLNLKTKRLGAGGKGRIPPVSKARNGGRAKTGKRAATDAALEEEYDKIVGEVADKLVSRLPRMPFPPTSSSTTSTDDSLFDLSATLSRITSLQAQLTTNIHSSNLLRRQIKLEQRALKRDRAELQTLEEGLKSSQIVRRKKERGLHVLARGGNEDLPGDEAEEIERMNTIAGIGTTTRATFATKQEPPSLGTDFVPDPELNPLLAQLRSHLLSMRNNMTSMQPVVAAMEEAKTALDAFAVRTLDEKALTKVYGVGEG